MIWLVRIVFVLALAIIASTLLVEWRRYRRQQRFFKELRFGSRQRNNAHIRRSILTRIMRDDRLPKPEDTDPKP